MMQRNARVWKRLLAFLVDLYLGIMVFSAFFLVMQSEVPASFGAALSNGLSSVAVATLVYASIFFLLYHAFCEYIIGQTPGMMLFGVEVKTQGKKPLRFWQALVRNIFLIPIIPFTFLWIVEPIYYLFQGERILERWTNTATVE
jgi:uncharacterized RDD family membrane protein YckC